MRSPAALLTRLATAQTGAVCAAVSKRVHDHNYISCRYTALNENFVLVSGCSSGDLETNGFEKRIQAIADLLIETVERTALFFG